MLPLPRGKHLIVFQEFNPITVLIKHGFEVFSGRRPSVDCFGIRGYEQTISQQKRYCQSDRNLNCFMLPYSVPTERFVGIPEWLYFFGLQSVIILKLDRRFKNACKASISAKICSMQ